MLVQYYISSYVTIMHKFSINFYLLLFFVLFLIKSFISQNYIFIRKKKYLNNPMTWKQKLNGFKTSSESSRTRIEQKLNL